MNENQPLVSVIMNCYNGGKYVGKAIESVIAQNYKNWEIIFWDNASNDNSASIAKSYNDSRIRYFKSDTTTPLGEARNNAVKQVKGDYISFLDCDDIWMYEKLQLQIDFLIKNKDISFLYSNAWVRFSPEKKRILYSRFSTLPAGDIFSHLLINNFINLQTVIFRKQLLDGLEQWFDPKFEIAEEYDLFLRMLYGKKSAYLSEPLVEYRIHNSMSTISKFHLIPNELELILKKLKDIVPNLHKNYHKNLQFYYGRIALTAATQCLIEKDKKNAILKLYPYRYLNIKYFLLFLIMHISVLLSIIILSTKNSGARGALSTIKSEVKKNKK